MKLNLLLDNKNGYLSGYVNVDPFCNAAPNERRIRYDITDLNEYVEDSECEEIRAIHILTYFDSNKVNVILDNWIKKLRINGTLIVGDIDTMQSIKAFQRGQIDIVQLNSLLWGGQTKDWEVRKCGLCMENICIVLQNKGLIVTEKCFEGFSFIIKAKRFIHEKQ